MSDYPKMLYLGPYRLPKTVDTAEEEAHWLAAYPKTPHDEPEPDPEPTTRKAKKHAH